MKSYLFCAAAAASLFAAPAIAQDRFPGARISVTGGLDAARGTVMYKDTSDPTNDFRDSASTTGLGYGATAGYDFRVHEHLYIGVEGSFDLADNKRCEEVFGSDAACFSVKRQWAIGGRFGAAVARHTMFYGGVAYVNGRARVSYTDQVDPTNNFAASDSRDGFRLSAGFEQKLSGNFFGTVEYRYSNYNNWTYASGAQSVSLGFQRHQALVGVGARF